ncbi:hypothetical protein rosag_00860 [Roseisolibacter agri]|uniref:Uncharacterized protein n=1 Tax=Roseisolibacter agri TaxID=2014610 RepID=A0AA37QD67_9BACT|nr:hypothetical protein rosag_00860 [Roseisolibacter agri]
MPARLATQERIAGPASSTVSVSCAATFGAATEAAVTTAGPGATPRTTQVSESTASTFAADDRQR